MLNFNVSGAERKRLVKKLETLLGERAVYQGMPSMSFKVGAYEVTKTGEVIPSLPDDIVEALARAGFTAQGEDEEGEDVGITITVPLETLTDGAVENFKNMTASKADLIMAAFKLRELPIETTDELLIVHWFDEKPAEDERVQFAATFVSAMLEKCRQQRYVSPKPVESDNQRYSFRIFLNALGFTGPDHKELRRILLADLTGSSAWRNGKPERQVAS